MDTRVIRQPLDYCEEALETDRDPELDVVMQELFDALPEETAPAEDIIKKPSHYARWVIEPITFIMRNGFEFWRGNIIKYASRAGFKMYPGKDAVESEITDLEKVKRYCDMRINQLNGETAL